MSPEPTAITSPTNPRVKRVVKLRQRSHRDELGLMLIEGYREIRRALANGHMPAQLFFCPGFFQGGNEPALIDECRAAGCEVLECTDPVFAKMAYRDRPEGLLAVAPPVRHSLDELSLGPNPLVIIAEAIEKPGNLGTILRSADAAGAQAVIVCDRCTDINNPNVVRASIGTLFSLPVVEVTTAEALEWAARIELALVATTPHTERLYTDVDFTCGVGIVLGTEQYGLSEKWLKATTVQVRIPMRGQGDSLNVASAATILLYEAVRQRASG